MVKSNTLQEFFPIPYLGPSPSLQESESTVDSTIDIPDNPRLGQTQRSPIVYRRHPRIPNAKLEGNERPAESCPTPADNLTMDHPKRILTCPLLLGKVFGLHVILILFITS